MKSMDDYELLDRAELAQRLKVSLRTLQRYIARGMLPKPVYLGRLVRWRTTDIIEWIDNGCKKP
ncbi:Helix-turn-helix domain protein [Polystyrenella longa]|uniref:Helix-turn-helix domain protein n=1 Tax=Polystyrenella longa TaxID=2528007 RepID=A0A518CKQ8_9PLAN|nr:helix-turn-helix domain-containing protein [Polystyrenella longa]QDU79813.1 Helix-turn-helix domain protein [Polystyrenella longa]